MVDFKDAELAQNALAHVITSLLRLKEATPQELRETGISVFKTRTPRPRTGGALREVARFEEKIRCSHDATADAIITNAIAQAIDAIERENRIDFPAVAETAAKFRAKVTRRQFAVGHGNFHAGRVQVLRTRHGMTETVFDQSYAYDCGSENTDAFTVSMQEYRREYAEQLEILFVSHLHADHINGIDRLLGYKVPRIVVLPYLDLEDIASIALQDFEANRFSGSYRDYIRDPVAWWHGRGVETVVFIEPGGDDGVAPEGPPPDDPIGGGDPDPRGWTFEESMVRLAARFHIPRGSVPAGLMPANPSVVDTWQLGRSSLLAGSGSLFRLEWKSDVRDAWRSADWCLVPYVHPVEDERRTALRKAVLAHLKLANPPPGEFQKVILEELTNPSKAKALVAVYGDYFIRDHNVVSLSLYSGPAASNKIVCSRPPWRSNWMWLRRSRAQEALSIPSGWLGTGDSMLKQNKRRSPWRKFYSRYNTNIGALTLPHHGSAHNFHDEVLDWEQLGLALATTEKKKARIADIDATLKSVGSAHKIALMVDERPANSLSCHSERELIAFSSKCSS